MSTQTITPTSDAQVAGAPSGAVLGALAAGCLFDFLFNGRSLGISLPLFLSITLALAWRTGIRHGRGPSEPQLATGLGALAFAVLAAWRAAPELMATNAVVSLYLFALSLAPWLKDRELREEEYLALPWDLLSESAGQGKREVAVLCREAKTGPIPLKAVASGLLAAAPILMVFLVLMITADAVYESLWTGLESFLEPSSAATHASIAAAVAVLFLGAWSWVASRRAEGEGTPSLWAAAAATVEARSWGFVEANVAAASVNLLFLSFAAVQALFLIGGKERIEALGTGITYSEYARQGFWQMILIGFLALLLSLLLDERVSGRTPAQRRVQKVNLLVASLLTGVMLASAAYRLRLYEQAYGFTVLRFYSHTFTAYVAGVFLLLCVKVEREQSRRAFARNACLATLALLIGWNLCNPHALIARANLAREGTPDVAYLETLSSDAVGVLAAAARGPLEEESRSRLSHGLAGRKAKLEARRAASGWPGYHWAHAAALRELNGGGSDESRLLARYRP